MGPTRTLKLQDGTEIEISTEQVLESHVQRTKRELQREDSILRMREALRPLIANMGIDDLAVVVSESVVQAGDQQTETLAERLKEILLRLDDPLSVEDEALLEQYQQLTETLRQLNETTKANKPLKAVEILNRVKTDVDLRKMEQTLLDLLQIASNEAPSKVNVTNFQPIKDLLQTLVDKELTDPDNPTDYINVRLSDGKVFYKPAGGKGGEATKLPFKQNGADAQVVLTPDGKVPIEGTFTVGQSNPIKDYELTYFTNPNASLVYLGYLKADGNWAIIKTDQTAGTRLFSIGEADFETAWTGKAGLTYVTYDEAF